MKNRNETIIAPSILGIEENRLFEELGLARGKFYVVYAGNLGKVQGVDVILEAAEMLKNKSDIHFVVFGNGSEEENIKKQAEHLTNVSIFPLQSMERVSEVYSLGDVSIIPCKPGTGGSGMPSKTWTIMATATTIIASFDLGGEMERTIKEAGCGCCVQAGDAKALADAIVRLKNDPETVKTMGKNGRRFAEEQVAKEQAVQKYIEIIEETVRAR